MPLPRKPSRVKITHAIQGLIRYFPSITVTIVRVTNANFNTGGMRGAPTQSIVYRGECLFVPAGETIKVLAAGLLPSQDPHLLISGNRAILQGDRVTVDQVLYEIDNTDNRWGAFIICKLRQVKITKTS